MPEHDQLDGLAALYWAVLGTNAGVDYLVDVDLLGQVLGVPELAMTALYFFWFVSLFRSLPGHLEVAFGG